MKIHDKPFMSEAIAQAKLAATQGEVPVGAVLVHEGQVIAKAHNAPIAMQDPCAHAEILALRAAGPVLQNYRLLETTLYVSLEPCPMCVAAMVHARIERCVYGASDPKTGACGGAVDLTRLPVWNHHVIFEGGVLADEASALLSAFFQAKRAQY